ncbi:hypothetical protein GCM10029963_13540 [Micromonospora andamanensis]
MATRGRPRTFDRQVALRRAMEVFWRRGYQGASMTELTAAMGIASPSLYAAFGSKEALFREAVELYNSTEGAGPRAALDGGVTARAAIEAMLRHQAYAYVDPANPSGCLVVLAGAGTVPESDAVGQFLTTCRERDITELRRRISRGWTRVICPRRWCLTHSPGSSARSSRAWRCRPATVPPPRISSASSTAPWRPGTA